MSIRIWDIPYVYGPVYTYGGEQQQNNVSMFCSKISSNNLVAKVMGIILLVLYGLRGRDP